MNIRLLTASLLTAVTLAMPAFATPVEDAASKPAKTVIQSVRYSKDLNALQEFAGDQQGRFMLGDAWDKITEAQRKEFSQLFQAIFAKIAFPRIRDNLKNLASITYDTPVIKGNEASMGSFIVLDTPQRKTELKVRYTLVKTGGDWKVLDATINGDSILAGIRDDQTRPVMKEGGIDRLLNAMRQKASERPTLR